MKIGEVSRLSGIGIEALRFYEKQGLLGRPARTESGYRLYGAEVRDVVRARLAEIDERIRQMRRYRKELAAALDEWEQAGDREGHICGLIESTAIKHTLPEKPVLKRGKR